MKLRVKPNKIDVVIILAVILLISILITVDCIRVNNGDKPVFCVFKDMYLDGGTIEYYGLGYKIIDYNVIDGYEGFKLGTWFMGYDSSL